MIDAITSPLIPMATWVLLASVKSSVVIAVIVLCRRIFSRWLTAQGRYLLWFPAIAALALPLGPQVNLPVAGHTEPAVVVDSSTTQNVIPQLTQNKVVAEATTIRATSTRVFTNLSPIANILSSAVQSSFIVAWLGVAMALLVFVLTNLMRYFRFRARAGDVDSAARNLFLQCKAQLNLNREVQLLESSQLQVPTLFGWWSPTLLLPSGITTQLSTDQLRHVFLHELTHVGRQDVLVNWLTSLVQIAHWFNPFVWYALRLMRSDMEQACDARVLDRLSRTEQLEYGDTLIRLSDFHSKSLPLAHGVGIVENNSQLKARVNMIAQFNPKTIRHSIFAALLVAAVASAASVQPRLDAEVGSSSARSRSIALAAATPQAVSQPAPEATSQQTPKPLPKLSTDEEAHRAALLQERQRLNRAKGEAVDAMTVAYIKINYMKAEDLVTLIRSTGISLLSDHGRVAADTRTNTLLVHDTNAMVTAIRELVTTLDVPLDHIQIEARIAIVDDVFLRNMYTNVKSGPSTASPPAQGGAGGWAAASTIAGDYNIDAELSAAQANHHAEVISSPRIIVENRKQAMIEQGIEVPYREANAATVSYKKMTLSVKVTPQITLDNRINLDIGVIRESLGLPTADSGGHSSSDTRRIQTQHQLIDKQTIVLGKIVEVEAIDKGAVAASSSSIDKRQLIVFLTPKIVHTEVASAN